MRIGSIVVGLVISAGPCVAFAQTSEPTLAQRLERVVASLETERENAHVPGMAIAIVKDDAVILSRGFGVMDLETQEPVTDETLFACGSTTKAFTATAIGMLVDDGRMGWDDPVRQHLPDYRLRDPEADANVVIRDLLCHRIGFASMSLLWYGNGVGADDVLQTALQAELLHPFRERWNYSNVSFLAAGMAASRADDMTWDEQMRTRIFDPLGMTSTTTTLAAVSDDPRLASGYRWDESRERFVHQPMQDLEAVAPAGAINSNVRDMAQWVRFQLGRGTFDGRTLLSANAHAETWDHQIDVAEGSGIGYGLGWFLRTWNGQPVIEHAGGIDGFTAEIAMLPDEKIGFVLLMNRFASPLQETSRGVVFDGLLGDWVEEGDDPSEDFAPYTGEYVANFATFEDVGFDVLVQDGMLAIDIPGQMVFALRPPDDDGMRQFAVGGIAIRFNENDQGAVTSMTMFQSGLEFELPRRGFEPVVDDLDRAAIAKFLGPFRADEIGQTVQVLVDRGSLALDVPGQMTFALTAPDAEGRRFFTVTDAVWVRFDEAEDGTVPTMTMSQRGQVFTFTRSGSAPEAPPSLEEVLARIASATGRDAFTAQAVRSRGTIEFPNLGLRGDVDTIATRDGRLRDDIDLGRFGRLLSFVEGDRAWIDMPFMRNYELHGATREQLIQQGPFVWFDEDAFEKMTIGERTEFEGKPVIALRCYGHDAPVRSVLVSESTWLPVAHRFMTVSPVGMQVAAVIRLDDWRPVGGMLMPHRVETSNDMSGRVALTYESIEVDPVLDSVVFHPDGVDPDDP